MTETHAHAHDHDHGNDEDNYLTLIDDNGNEALFEVLLTIDGQEELGKNYVLLVPAGRDESDEDVEITAYAFTQNEDGTEGDLMAIPEDSEEEWSMIEDVFNQFVADQEDEV